MQLNYFRASSLLRFMQYCVKENPTNRLQLLLYMSKLLKSGYRTVNEPCYILKCLKTQTT